MKPAQLLATLALLAVASLLLALGSGGSAGFGELFDLMTGDGTPLHDRIILELRLPRVLGAFSIGAMLAVAGALLQVLLGNPLADPYVLGVSGGAATGALLALLLGLAGIGVPAAALTGALFSTLLVFGLARGRGAWSPVRLLLTGVVIAAGWGAVIGLLLAVAPQANLKGMLFWLMGDLSQLDHPGPGLGVLTIGLLLAMPMARSLNVLARGELTAGALGVAVAPLRGFIYFTAALLTATAVTLGGSIGFVGLVVPHLLRLTGGGDHRFLLPGSALLGGMLLVIADTLARTLIAPQQLPVGILTALIGVPLFLWLLHRGAR